MKVSAGLLVFRADPTLEVLLVHPGGPFFARRDKGWWSIPKGELDVGEEPLAAAYREVAEEVGPGAILEGDPIPLGTVKQRSGKLVHGWAVGGTFDPAELHSNPVVIDWPPRSGRRIEFPEVDRAEWFDPAAARTHINPAQIPFIDRLEAELSNRG